MNINIIKQIKLGFYIIYKNLMFLCFILLMLIIGIIILYSASNKNSYIVYKQIIKISIALFSMIFISSISPYKYKIYSPCIYSIGIILLITVILIGKIGNGAKRWLNIEFFSFQPSEIMKLSVPMMISWYINRIVLPFNFKNLLIVLSIILFPTLLIAKQPDLGTAIIVAIVGIMLVCISKIPKKFIIQCLLILVLCIPISWHYMYNYQKQRILTLFNLSTNPLSTGYHIIQSKIAIGSGGLLGKGLLHGSQSHLHFLPECTTDFIFAVNSEEFGFLGNIIIIILIFCITIQIIQIAKNTNNRFLQLLCIGLSMNFLVSSVINIGMVIGIVPIVGVPLPLVSYGGTSMIIYLDSFGLIMSINYHCKFYFRKEYKILK